MKVQLTAPPLTGLVLAGGRSTRMGRDKALLEIGGEPLVVRTARFLAGFCAEVILAGGDRPDLTARCRAAGLQVVPVPDARAGAGPLAGLVSGLERASHPLIAVVAADLPYPSRAVLWHCAALARARGVAVVPEVAGRPQPLHAVWPQSSAPLLRRHLEENRLALLDAVEAAHARILMQGEWERVEPDGSFTLNLNHPADLEGLGRGQPRASRSAESAGRSGESGRRGTIA